MGNWLRLGVSATLLGLVFWHTDWVQFGEAFSQLRVEFWLLAVVILCLTQLVSAMRWMLFARAFDLSRPLSQFTGIYFIGMFFNLALPTSVGGDVIRAWYLDASRKLVAFVTVLLDRASGLGVLLTLACVGFLASPLQLPAWIGWSVWGVAGCALVGLVAATLIAWKSTADSVRGRQIRTAVKVLRCPRLLAATTVLSFVVQAANVVIVMLVGMSLNLDIPASFLWILVPMVSLLTLLPVSVNGMGVREGGTALFLAPLGVGQSAALSLALLWFAVYATTGLLGGLVYLFGHFARPATATEMGEETAHGCVGSYSDQGRAGQYRPAA